MNAGIIKKRVKAIRYQTGKKSLLVRKPANVTYTTGFSGDDSWVLFAGINVYLFTDSRFSEQAKNECPACIIIERKGPMAQAVAELLKNLKQIGRAAWRE